MENEINDMDNVDFGTEVGNLSDNIPDFDTQGIVDTILD